MFANLLLIGSCMATFAIAEPIPYPPQVTETPTVHHPTLPSFGNKHGNFQPENKTAIASKPTKTFKRATGGWVQNGNLAVWNINNYDGIGGGSDSYNMYWGDGSTGAGWPARSSWVSFTDMFNNNKNLMFQSCSQFGVANDDGPEVGAIYDGIQSVAQQTGVDHRFILAVLMQESGGCVRAPTTNWGVRNPGLMQDHNGAATCNDAGWVQNPCPTDTVRQMIYDGTGGTNDGDGLAQCINEAGYSDAQAFYRAARIYNSGSIAGSGRLEDGIATHCYSSDIANRLTGWVWAGHGCSLG